MLHRCMATAMILLAACTRPPPVLHDTGGPAPHTDEVESDSDLPDCPPIADPTPGYGIAVGQRYGIAFHRDHGVVAWGGGSAREICDGKCPPLYRPPGYYGWPQVETSEVRAVWTTNHTGYDFAIKGPVILRTDGRADLLADAAGVKGWAGRLKVRGDLGPVVGVTEACWTYDNGHIECGDSAIGPDGRGTFLERELRLHDMPQHMGRLADGMCALYDDGRIRCNTWTDVDDPAGPFRETSPCWRHLAGQSPSRPYHTPSCALDAEGLLWCLDENDQRLLGPIATGSTYTQLAVHREVWCALDKEGVVTCGVNPEYLDRFTPSRRAELMPPSNLPPAIAVAPGGVPAWGACALHADGALTCWGDYDPGIAKAPSRIAAR